MPESITAVVRDTSRDTARDTAPETARDTVRTDTVTRPAGLRHGRYESGPLYFYSVAFTGVFVAVFYLYFRLKKSPQTKK